MSLEFFNAFKMMPENCQYFLLWPLNLTISFITRPKFSVPFIVSYELSSALNYESGNFQCFLLRAMTFPLLLTMSPELFWCLLLWAVNFPLPFTMSPEFFNAFYYELWTFHYLLPWALNFSMPFIMSLDFFLYLL